VDSENADILAVGFRGTSGILEDFMLGSVSRAVVHAAKVPVLIVKSQRESSEPAKQSPGPVAQHLHVLVAYDEPQLGERTAAVLTKFSWPPETRGWAISVVRPMFITELPDWIKVKRDPDVAAMATAWEVEHQQQLEATRGDLERFRATLPECFTSEGLIVAEGRPAEEILAQVREKAIDLVAIGSRSSGTFKRLLLGSTSEQVLREAPCSVLVVR
jgi:nucleotide-binding universal stress UspA family protein